MPYFRRGGGIEAGPMAAAASAAIGPASGIVERAGKILEDQPLPEISHAVRPSLVPLQSPPVSPALGGAQQQMSELLAGFLQQFAPSTLPVPSSLTKDVPLTRSVPAGEPRTIPVIEVETSIAAGSEAVVALPIVNDGPTFVDAVPYCTDFISNTGHQIAAQQVTFQPRSLPLATGTRGTTQLRVALPMQVGPGKYSALVQVMGLEGPRAVVVLIVS